MNFERQPAGSNPGADGEVCMFYEIITLLSRRATADHTNFDSISLRLLTRNPDHPSSTC